MLHRGRPDVPGAAGRQAALRPVHPAGHGEPGAAAGAGGLRLLYHGSHNFINRIVSPTLCIV